MGTNTTSSYLDPPQLHGKMNSDGTYTLSALEMKAQSDFNYRVASMIQGGLNLANLTVDTKATFNNMVTFTDLSTGGSTVINGDNVTTGTLRGVTLISKNAGTTSQVKIADGELLLLTQEDMLVGGLSFDANTSKIVLHSDWGMPLKLVSANNMSVDVPQGNTIFVGTGNTGERIEIGSATSTLNMSGTVLHNGNPLGTAVFS